MTTANKENYYAYNPKLQPNAHKLRYTMTKSEACLWKYVLKAGKMKGYTFNRQRPVINYIADFMCKELKLIIEADGITHTFEEVIKNDAIRQKKLEDAGFKVIRFTDEEILKRIESVRKVIENVIEELEAISPRPAPSRGGQRTNNNLQKNNEH